jgi:ATP-dependent Clp protease, protease subunit
MITIPPRAPIVYITFTADIDPRTTEALITVLSDCADQGAQSVYLLLSTDGGSVMHGMTLYNMIRALPFPVTTHNVGNVNSMGNVLFLAGATRYACPHSTFMFHGVGFNAGTGQRFDERALKEQLASVVADQVRMGNIIRERTKLDAKAIGELFLGAQTKDAAWAHERGIVDDVRDADIPAGAPLFSLAFQR